LAGAGGVSSRRQFNGTSTAANGTFIINGGAVFGATSENTLFSRTLLTCAANGHVSSTTAARCFVPAAVIYKIKLLGVPR
jgi:hypothetical protein